MGLSERVCSEIIGCSTVVKLTRGAFRPVLTRHPDAEPGSLLNGFERAKQLLARSSSS
jgi:hypothetical protein